MKTFHCKIARQFGPYVQTLDYIGPVDRIPQGWAIVMRRVVQ